MSDLTVDNLTKRFGAATALDGISFDVADGELVSLLGPSGCGKSTTLWSIAGLHSPDSGRIVAGGTSFFDGAVNVPPERRNCGVVFQSYAIWPHMRVRDVIAYPLKLRRVPRDRRDHRVREMLGLLELDGLGDRYPHQLSGGQQQRVALARALAHPPRVLLLDEPFSNLDAKLRDRARDWVRHIQQSAGVTTVFVTHDQHEALALSDRVVVMSNGRVHQIATPEDVYHRPADLYVAGFVGATNALDADVTEVRDDHCLLRVDGIDQAVIANTRPAGDHRRVTAVVRPEDVTVHEERPAAGPGNLLAATVSDREFLGDHYGYTLRAGGAVITARSRLRLPSPDVWISVDPAAIQVFAPAGDAR